MTIKAAMNDPMFQSMAQPEVEVPESEIPLDTSWLDQVGQGVVDVKRPEDPYEEIIKEMKAERERAGSDLAWLTKGPRMRTIEAVKQFHRLFGDAATATVFGNEALDYLPKRRLPKGYEGVTLNKEGKYIDIYGKEIEEPPEFQPGKVEMKIDEPDWFAPEGSMGPMGRKVVTPSPGEVDPASRSLIMGSLEFITGFENINSNLMNLMTGSFDEKEIALDNLVRDAAWWLPFVGPQSKMLLKAMKFGGKKMLQGAAIPPRKIYQAYKSLLKDMGQSSALEGLWETVTWPLKQRVIPTFERGPLRKKSFTEIFQSGVERVDKKTAGIFRRTQAQKALVTKFGQELGGKIQGLTVKERNDVLNALKKWKPGYHLSYFSNTGKGREVLSHLQNQMKEFKISGTYAEHFESALEKTLKKHNLSAVIATEGDPALEGIIDRISGELKGTRDYKKIQKYLSEQLDSGALDDTSKVLLRDLHSLGSTSPEAVAVASKHASRRFLIGELKSSGVVQASLKDAPKELEYVASHYPGLKGSYVPRDVELELRALDTMPKIASGVVGRFISTPMTMWKTAKVILRPATHVRNTLSNIMLNDWGGLPFYRMDIYKQAFEEMLRDGKHWKEWQRITGGGGTFSVNEVTQLHSGFKYHIKKLGKSYDIQKATMWDVGLTWFDKMAHVPREIYNAEEQYAKLAKFIWNKKQGMNVEEAALDAMKWTFNYGEVTRATGYVRQLAAPFFTWQVKVLPLMAETAVKHPLRMAKWGVMFSAMQAQALKAVGMSDSEWDFFQKIMPQYIQDGQFLMVPFRDEKRRFQLLNLSYMIPGWGDLNDLQNSPISWALGNPMITIGGALLYNKTFGGAPIYYDWEEPSTKAMKMFQFTWNQVMPPQLSGAVGGSGFWKKIYDTYQEHPDALTWPQIAASSSGFKITPIDPVKALHKFKAVQNIHKAQEGSWLRKEMRRARSPQERRRILEQHMENVKRMMPFQSD